MKKREFLAMGGAVPLVLAGCGGDSGSAPVRLVNASIGYPLLGFTVETTQATTSDVAYGSASPFESVQAGTVTTNLTTTVGGVVTDLPIVTRSLSKDSRYSLVAYGYSNAPKSVLITESTTAPDTGKANFNVLNTSTDVGAVDVYLTANRLLTSSDTPVISSIGSSAQIAQSGFAATTASSSGATYFITVTAAGSVASGTPDYRYQMPVGSTGITLKDQDIVTLIISPGQSGVLANCILLTQGSNGAAVSLPNSSARVRAIAATGNSGVVAVGTNPVVLAATVSPAISDYVLVTAGAAPPVQYTASGAAAVQLQIADLLAAGNDYTLMIYLDANGDGGVTQQLILDDNTRPASATDAKVRLINLVYDTDASNPLTLSLTVNAAAIASNVTYAIASTYTEIPAITTTQSTIQVTSGFTTVLANQVITLTAGNVYTEVVAGVGSAANVTAIVGKFSAARTS